MPIAPATLLSDATAEEGGTLERNAEVYVRPYPFPFIAAFALSNDCDSCSMEAFEDWHAFVNGRASTPYGEGLGLEIGDSFWVWLNGSGGLALSMGAADEPVREPAYVDRMAEIGRAGVGSTRSTVLEIGARTTRVSGTIWGRESKSSAVLRCSKPKGSNLLSMSITAFPPSNVSGRGGFIRRSTTPRIRCMRWT